MVSSGTYALAFAVSPFFFLFFFIPLYLIEEYDIKGFKSIFVSFSLYLTHRNNPKRK